MTYKTPFIITLILLLSLVVYSLFFSYPSQKGLKKQNKTLQSTNDSLISNVSATKDSISDFKEKVVLSVQKEKQALKTANKYKYLYNNEKNKIIYYPINVVDDSIIAIAKRPIERKVLQSD